MSSILLFDSTIANEIKSFNLGGAVYQIQKQWNVRAKKWCISIYTAAGDPIIDGHLLITNYALFNRFTDQRLPPGRIIAVDTGLKNREPSRFDLGNAIKIIYDDQLVIE
jgi:hypothetical protein